MERNDVDSGHDLFGTSTVSEDSAKAGPVRVWQTLKHFLALGVTIFFNAATCLGLRLTCNFQNKFPKACAVIGHILFHTWMVS